MRLLLNLKCILIPIRVLRDIIDINIKTGTDTHFKISNIIIYYFAYYWYYISYFNRYLRQTKVSQRNIEKLPFLM